MNDKHAPSADVFWDQQYTYWRDIIVSATLEAYRCIDEFAHIQTARPPDWVARALRVEARRQVEQGRIKAAVRALELIERNKK